MRRMGLSPRARLVVLGVIWSGSASAQVLTAEQAVKMALEQSTQAIGAEASVLDARGGMYGAYSGVLPRVSLGITRQGAWQEKSVGSNVFGGVVIPGDRRDFEQYSTTPSASYSWDLINLSALNQLSSARRGMTAAQQGRVATRAEVAYLTRRQFYEVVRSERLVQVATGSLRLARDDERRVRALFEVGSVSRNDLLRAQVRTSQSELDSLTSQQTVTNQRVLLAGFLGIKEADLGVVDTLLTTELREFDRAALLAETEKQQPDLLAAEAEFTSAQAGLRAAKWARLPYLTLSGGARYRPKSDFTQTTFDTNGVALPEPFVDSGNSKSDLEYSAALSLNLDLFTGFATEGRIASAQARYMRAQETRDATRRNLAAQIDQALLGYRRANEAARVARRAVESSTENLKLTQEKYNVGSATILDLIDAQVQLQLAQSDGVTAQTAIRVAEAQINRIRGRAE